MPTGSTYQETPNNVSNSITNSDSLALQDEETVDTIVAVVTNGGSETNITVQQVVVSSGEQVTVPAGTDLTYLATDDTIQTTGISLVDAKVVVFQTQGGVEASFIDTTPDTNDSLPDRVIIGSAGNDSLTILDNKDSHIVLVGGDDTVVAGGGNDTILAGVSNATIDAGLGTNLVIMQGTSTNYVVDVAGDSVSPGNRPQSHGGSHVVVTNATTGVTTQLTGVQYVELDNNDALIFAESTVEAGIAALYHAAFDRTGEFEGINFWFNHAKNGMSLRNIAWGFAQSAEFDQMEAMTDTNFIQTLYQNVFNRAADAGGLAYWLGQLGSGVARADVMMHFARVAALNEDGSLSTEATIVGNVTIVQDIV